MNIKVLGLCLWLSIDIIAWTMVFAYFTAVYSPIGGVWLEIKYVIYDPFRHPLHLEVVGMMWINGAPDYNDRPHRFRAGENVTITCPEHVLGAKFAFWEMETPRPTFQGVIVSDRNLTIVLTKPKTVWWANYAGNLTSLDGP